MSLKTIGTLVEAAWQRVQHIFSHKLLLLKHQSTRPTSWPVHFYPDFPNSRTVCYRILHRIGIKLRKGLPSPSQQALVFLWRDETFTTGLTSAQCGEEWVVVNRDCLDISKERVQSVHQQVFGYSLEVNPLEFQGRMLTKSNLNGAHDGYEVKGPVSEVKQGVIYQRIVNNTPSTVPVELENEKVICDIRVPIFGQSADFVYLKYRSKNLRYSNANNFVQVVETCSVLNQDECALIDAFCREFKLDYGEIDVVRDANDQRIYILDVNKTPFGPPNGLPPGQQTTVLARYEKAFCDWFERLRLADRL